MDAVTALRSRCSARQAAERTRILHACEPARAEILARVEAAMSARGLDHVESRARRWYTTWIDKSVDELVYLELDDAERRRMVVVEGLAGLDTLLADGVSVLLAGLHLGAHTLGIVHLDTLGYRSTILVHQAMLAVMPEYHLRHADWCTPGTGFVRRMTDRPGLFVTYLDVGVGGDPVEPGEDGVRRTPGMRLAAVAGSALTWDFTRRPGTTGPLWRMRVSPLPIDDSQSWTARRLRGADTAWMLWRRVTLPGNELQTEMRWAGNEQIIGS